MLPPRYATPEKDPNAQGELGRLGDPLVPMRVEGELQGRKIVAIAAGRCHSLAVDSEGHLYSWGCNGGGQLAQPPSGNVKEPKLVQGHFDQKKVME